MAYLAGAAVSGLRAFGALADFWRRLRSADVYELDVPAWVHVSRLKGSGGALASDLLFERGFVQALIAPGERDARAQGKIACVLWLKRPRQGRAATA